VLAEERQVFSQARSELGWRKTGSRNQTLVPEMGEEQQQRLAPELFCEPAPLTQPSAARQRRRQKALDVVLADVLGAELATPDERVELPADGHVLVHRRLSIATLVEPPLEAREHGAERRRGGLVTAGLLHLRLLVAAACGEEAHCTDCGLWGVRGALPLGQRLGVRRPVASST